MSERTTETLPTEQPRTATALTANSPLGKAENWTDIQSYAEALQMADLVSRSSFCPKAFQGNPGDIVVAWYFGKQLDLPPLVALQNLAVINGKPCIYGDAIPALCMSHPDFMGTKVVWGDNEDELDCTVIVKRKMPDGAVEEFKGHFSKAKAEQAKLWGKTDKYGKPTPWVLYPHDMVQRRAASRAWRAAFSDRLMGLTSSDEAEDIRPVDVDVRDTTAADAVKAVEVALAGGEPKAEVKVETVKPLDGEKVDPAKLPNFQRKTAPAKKDSKEGDRWLRTSDDVMHVFRNGKYVVEGSDEDVVAEPQPEEPETEEAPAEEPADDPEDPLLNAGGDEPEEGDAAQEMDRQAMVDYINKNGTRMPKGFFAKCRERYNIPDGQGLSAVSDEDLYDMVTEIEGHISV
ncbi:MAG: hypothetical protein ACPGQD_08100 [Planctomycetota bacterium]